jgi:DNA-binding HxlR family transcriptional regulator
VASKSNAQRRSGCPVSISLELLGDRWSLLIVRDMMVRGASTFRQFQRSGEGISTNILADRLHKLEAAGIAASEPAPEDGRSSHYRLTEKGIALAPVLLELLIWGAHHEQTDAPCEVIEQMEENRAAVLAETYRRWKERDPAPILPPFQKPSAPARSKHGKQAKELRLHPKSPKGKLEP